MSTEPRMASAPQLREVRAAARRQASTLWGGTMLVVGTLIVAAVMVLVVVLDYHFNQPIHRVIKFLLGAAAGAGFVLVPWSGLFIIPDRGSVPALGSADPGPGDERAQSARGRGVCKLGDPSVLRRQPIFRTSFLGKGMLILLVTFALAVIRGAAIPTGYTYDAFDAAVELFRVSMNLSIYVVTLSIASGARDRRAFTWAVILGSILESVTTIVYGRNGSGGRAIGSIGQLERPRDVPGALHRARRVDPGRDAQPARAAGAAWRGHPRLRRDRVQRCRARRCSWSCSASVYVALRSSRDNPDSDPARHPAHEHMVGPRLPEGGG